MSNLFGEDDAHSSLKNFWDEPDSGNMPSPRLPVKPADVKPIGMEPIRPPDEVSRVTEMDIATSAEYEIDDLLEDMLKVKGSDLHLSMGFPPAVRVHGDMTPLPGYPVLTSAEIQRLVFPMMTEQQQKSFEEDLELDMSYELVGKSRFRVNLLKQKESFGSVMRTIPFDILPLEALGISSVLNDFAHYERGLVLITGPTGSGKSTTLAAIIDKANRSRKGHILTIEDPVEFVHPHKQCIVNQREVGVDTKSFADAMKHALREDPDIILVGELRDLETISLAISLAETGHLVFGTLHTQSAPQTISRIIDVFPSNQQAMVQTQLAETLKAVVCQTLLKTADGKGRQAALEIMIATQPIRAQIRDNKIEQIAGYIETSSRYGMNTMDQDLVRLVNEKRVRPLDALAKAHNKDNFIANFGNMARLEHMQNEINEKYRRTD